MFDIKSSLASEINLLGKALAKESTVALKKHATNVYGWPSDISNQVGIEYSKGKFSHPSNVSNTLKDIEYGAPDSILAPAIRSFMGRY